MVSIITINYNNVLGLEKTIQSVISQTYNNYEFIVVDGASTDGSVALLEHYKAYIHCSISEKDAGIYHAMNKGIKMAKGDYLLFLNSGDVLTSASALIDFVDHPLFKGDIIYGDYQFENGEKVYPDTLPSNYFMKTSLPHQSTFFNRRVFELMGPYDETYQIGADRAFFIQCFESKKITFQHIPYFLTLFDLSGVSNNSAYLKKKETEDEQMLFQFYGTAYTNYKEEVRKNNQIKKAQRNSLKGILKRIKNRLILLCR
ncbi:MAG: glycosyltransferase family 2 protein [Flavobacteriaceae bacterium]